MIPVKFKYIIRVSLNLIQREDNKIIPLSEIHFCQCQKEVNSEKHLDPQFLRSE